MINSDCKRKKVSAELIQNIFTEYGQSEASEVFILEVDTMQLDCSTCKENCKNKKATA